MPPVDLDAPPKWQPPAAGHHRTLTQAHPKQTFVQADRRLGDRDNRTHWQSLPADEYLTMKPNSPRRLPPATTKSGHHLCSSSRTHYGGSYPHGGGRGPGGPRDLDATASVTSDVSADIEQPWRAPHNASKENAGTKKTRPSPTHGFQRTHSGGYWTRDGVSDAASLRSSKSEKSCMTSSSVRERRQGRKTLTMGGLGKDAAGLNLPKGEFDRIKGFSRKPGGGYWKDREHLDPDNRRPRTARGSIEKYARASEEVGKHERMNEVPERCHSSDNFFFDSTPLKPMNPTRDADTTSPGPGYVRTYYGGYYRRENRFKV